MVISTATPTDLTLAAGGPSTATAAASADATEAAAQPDLLDRQTFELVRLLPGCPEATSLWPAASLGGGSSSIGRLRFNAGIRLLPLAGASRALDRASGVIVVVWREPLVRRVVAGCSGTDWWWRRGGHRGCGRRRLLGLGRWRQLFWMLALFTASTAAIIVGVVA